MVTRFEHFTYAISEIHRYWHKIAADEMTKYGLKGPYAVYLATLHRHPEGITASRLGEECGRDKSDVSRAIAVMLEKEMIKRTGKSQKYRAQLVLTEKGRIAAEHVSERARMAVEEGGRGLDEERRTVLYETLDLIVSNLHKVSETGLGEK